MLRSVLVENPTEHPFAHNHTHVGCALHTLNVLLGQIFFTAVTLAEAFPRRASWTILLEHGYPELCCRRCTAVWHADIARLVRTAIDTVSQYWRGLGFRSRQAAADALRRNESEMRRARSWRLRDWKQAMFSRRLGGRGGGLRAGHCRG